MAIALLLLVALGAPFSLWLYVTGNPGAYLQPQVPDGQLLYVLSKLAGLCAISLLGFQMILVCIRGLSRKVGWSNRHHRLLGFAVFLMMLLHVGLFVSAASIRSEHLALGLFKIRVFQGFYDFMVSVGLVSACLMIGAVGMGFWFHRHRSICWLQRTHVWFVLSMTTLALLHSYSIGSETRSVPVVLFYLVILAATLFTMVTVFRGRRFHGPGRN